MASTLLPSRGMALHGAPDTDIATKDAKSHAVQVMQLDLTQDIVDELLASARSGKSPQILFGRNPQLKYGDKSHVLQTTSENLRYELYHCGGPEGDDEYTFAGLINHTLAIQHAEQVTSGVDTALEQLKNSMAALSEMKEANKTVVGDASSLLTPAHRRGLSKNFKPQQHLKPSSNLSSPLRSAPSSPALLGSQNLGKGPTSQPNSQSEKSRALRYVTIHYLASEPQRFEKYMKHVRASNSDCKEVLQKVGKNQDGNWHITDRAFKEIDPYKFPYKSSEDREKAVKNAVKAFDRLRIAKDDKLWQILLPKEERGKGKCLSRLNVTAPADRPATPMQKISKLTEKKAVPATKGKEKESEKEGKKVREVKEKKVAKEEVKDKRPVKASAKDESKMVKEKKVTGQSQAATAKPKVKKSTALATAAEDSSASTPRQKAKATTKTTAKASSSQEKMIKSTRPAVAPGTKPKNPSPLSASPPVNASDFEDSHPVHKALSAAPSPAKTSSGNSDRMLKRKANDLDDNIHNHNLGVKSRRVERPTPTTTPLSTSGKTSTPSSAQSFKRKAALDTDASDLSRTHTPAAKARKINNIDTAAAARYSAASPQSDSTTSPPLPLSYRQTIELSQKFERYYKRYEQLYWQIAESKEAPSDEQRDGLMKMHRKLEEMKREIKAGASHAHLGKGERS